jgi:hypothetical protein
MQLASLRIPGLADAVTRGRLLVRSMGLEFSQDAFRQVCTAHLLANRLKTAFPSGGPSVIAAIGDGHGILSALLHLAYPNAQIWLIDLGPTLVFQSFHLGRAFPTASHAIAGEELSGVRRTFIYQPAEVVGPLLPAKIDLAVNVASMQEMSPEVVANYFRLLRSRKTDFF